ncbi:MAG: polysaccharide biosynthesis protein, partial [Bacteroidales bacterium]|nr:polysaccharide biosynthesis protein [Bacteroidales bacterium]
ENTLPTPHNRIRIAKVREYEYSEVNETITQLTNLSYSVNIPDMVKLMKKIVPEFKSQNSQFEIFDK